MSSASSPAVACLGRPLRSGYPLRPDPTDIQTPPPATAPPGAGWSIQYPLGHRIALSSTTSLQPLHHATLASNANPPAPAMPLPASHEHVAPEQINAVPRPAAWSARRAQRPNLSGSCAPRCIA